MICWGSFRWESVFISGNAECGRSASADPPCCCWRTPLAYGPDSTTVVCETLSPLSVMVNEPCLHVGFPRRSTLPHIPADDKTDAERFSRSIENLTESSPATASHVPQRLLAVVITQQNGIPLPGQLQGPRRSAHLQERVDITTALPSPRAERTLLSDGQVQKELYHFPRLRACYVRPVGFSKQATRSPSQATRIPSQAPDAMGRADV